MRRGSAEAGQEEVDWRREARQRRQRREGEGKDACRGSGKVAEPGDVRRRVEVPEMRSRKPAEAPPRQR
eukprot:3941779-Rhodomonas_salina.2